jgi:hypothetical protein
MKRIINTLLISTLSVLFFSCAQQESLEVPMNEAIVLDISSSATKADFKEDNATESFVHHIDVLIFTDVDGISGVVKHYDRYVVNNASQLTLDVKRSSFEVGASYHVYLVANSNLSEADFAAVENYDDFVGMKQTDENLHLSGLTNVSNAPKYFLMDAKVTEILNNGNVADNTVLYATLRRAAAKVVINIKAGEDVRFADFDEAIDGTLISDGGLYYIRNLPYQAFLLAEARADETIDADVIALKNTPKSEDGHFKWNPETDNQNVSLMTYVYPNSWTSDIINRETCAVVNLPLIYTPDGGESVEHHNSWYKIHMTGEKVFRRNNYYEVNVVINRPGATSETVPIDIEDVHYNVELWTPHSVNVGGDDKPSYLQLNQKHVDMYNINTDDSTLEFASSSSISSIVLDEAYYINYLGQKVNVSDKNRAVYNAIKATAQADVLNGKITIYSPFIEGDGFEESHGNAIRYMTFTVTNQDGKSQTFTVNQYPTLYITHEMGKYSYRSDFGGTNYYTKGNPNRAGASWTGSGWSYSDRASSSVFFGSKVALGTEGNYTINYAYWGNNSSRVSTSVFGGLNNPRMYHIHVTATSSEYTVARPRLDAEGYTESTAENTKLVSPSFMAASQLGATQRLTGEVAQAKAHCEQYIEVTADGTVYDDWRLPTAAELDIIIKHQETSDAMATILTEGAYYCAYNTDRNGKVIYTKETGKNTSTTPVRCVRDAY